MCFCVLFIFCRKAIQGEIKISTENGETRTLRSAPDWGVSYLKYRSTWLGICLPFAGTSVPCLAPRPNCSLVYFSLYLTRGQETAINGDHLWVSTSASGDLCYVGESECSVSGSKHLEQTVATLYLYCYTCIHYTTVLCGI